MSCAHPTNARGARKWHQHGSRDLKMVGHMQRETPEKPSELTPTIWNGKVLIETIRPIASDRAPKRSFHRR